MDTICLVMPTFIDHGSNSSSKEVKRKYTIPQKLRYRFTHVWRRMYRRSRRVAVVEVDSKHSSYTMLVALRDGIHSILTDPNIPGSLVNIIQFWCTLSKLLIWHYKLIFKQKNMLLISVPVASYKCMHANAGFCV